MGSDDKQLRWVAVAMMVGMILLVGVLIWNHSFNGPRLSSRDQYWLDEHNRQRGDKMLREQRQKEALRGEHPRY